MLTIILFAFRLQATRRRPAGPDWSRCFGFPSAATDRRISRCCLDLSIGGTIVALNADLNEITANSRDCLSWHDELRISC